MVGEWGGLALGTGNDCCWDASGDEALTGLACRGNVGGARVGEVIRVVGGRATFGGDADRMKVGLPARGGGTVVGGGKEGRNGDEARTFGDEAR